MDKNNFSINDIFLSEEDRIKKEIEEIRKSCNESTSMMDAFKGMEEETIEEKRKNQIKRLCIETQDAMNLSLSSLSYDSYQKTILEIQKVYDEVFHIEREPYLNSFVFEK